MAYMESPRSTVKELIKLLRHSSASAGIHWVIIRQMEKKQLKEQKKNPSFVVLQYQSPSCHQCKHTRVCVPGQEELPQVTVNKTWFAILHSTPHYEEVRPKPLHSDAFVSGRTIIIFTSN